jgi:hypothetical protein
MRRSGGRRSPAVLAALYRGRDPMRPGWTQAKIGTTTGGVIMMSLLMMMMMMMMVVIQSIARLLRLGEVGRTYMPSVFVPELHHPVVQDVTTILEASLYHVEHRTITTPRPSTSSLPQQQQQKSNPTSPNDVHRHNISVALCYKALFGTIDLGIVLQWIGTLVVFVVVVVVPLMTCLLSLSFSHIDEILWIQQSIQRIIVYWALMLFISFI